MHQVMQAREEVVVSPTSRQRGELANQDRPEHLGTDVTHYRPICAIERDRWEFDGSTDSPWLNLALFFHMQL